MLALTYPTNEVQVLPKDKGTFTPLLQHNPHTTYLPANDPPQNLNQHHNALNTPCSHIKLDYDLSMEDVFTAHMLPTVECSNSSVTTKTSAFPKIIALPSEGPYSRSELMVGDKLISVTYGKLSTEGLDHSLWHSALIHTRKQLTLPPPCITMYGS